MLADRSLILLSPERLCQRQTWILTATHWTEFGVSEEMEKGRKELTDFVAPMGGATVSTVQIPRSSQGLDHQPKRTYGGTHGSSHICDRGWPCWTSVGEVALGPDGFCRPIVGKCQGRKTGVGGWYGRAYIEAEEGGWDRGFLEGRPGKGITFEM